MYCGDYKGDSPSVSQSSPTWIIHPPIIVKPPKSVAIRIILAIFCGSIGLFYSSILGGVVMLVISCILNFFGEMAFDFGLLFTVPLTSLICTVWSYISITSYNEKFLSGQI